jgi:hypothetical protein
MAAIIPLMTEVGMNPPKKPVFNTPKTICISPANKTAVKNNEMSLF